MPHLPATSRATQLILAAFASRPDEWRYGYDLSREVSVKSGTLYPMLIRLTDQGLLTAQWHDAERPGRPPRHAYRLTPKGLAFVRSSGRNAASPPAARGALA
jgi:DNA-binding PadR family transcriptional regulator